MGIPNHRSRNQWIISSGVSGYRSHCQGAGAGADSSHRVALATRFNSRIELVIGNSQMKLRIKNQIRRAFTLLEVMVALGLMSIVVVAIYSSWTAILKGSKVALDASAAAQRTRMTTRALHDSLMC